MYKLPGNPDALKELNLSGMMRTEAFKLRFYVYDETNTELSRFVLAQKSDWICIWRMYDSELLSELPYNQAGVSMPDYRAALVVKALEIEYNIFNV